MKLKISNPPPTLRELCLTKMREAIYTGYLPSGSRLTERKLCDELGVSRSVVREALRYLEAEGLVEVLPNKGPIVAVLDWETASQIYEIRLLLEKSAVASCIKNLTPKTEKLLKESLIELEVAFQNEPLSELLEASKNLYKTIFTAAKHQVAWDIVQRLNGRISRLRALTIKSENREVTGFKRMEVICQAIYLDKDIKKAQQAVSDHICEVKSISKTFFEQSNIFKQTSQKPKSPLTIRNP